jgi:hypothetical protein
MRVAVHLQVPYLEVPSRWRVGDVVFWPLGLQRRRLVRLGDIGGGPLEHLLAPLEDPESPWATVRVLVCAGDDRFGHLDAKAAVNEARSEMRDAVAVLSLLKRARVPRFGGRHQDFGLPTDAVSIREDSWVTDPAGRFLAGSGRRDGSLAAWRFSVDDVVAYRRDPRFQYLDALLRKRDRGPWERRILAALRTLSIANATYRPATRIVLAATALDALFGRDYEPKIRATGGHQLARRAAFLLCGEPTDRHGPMRPACPYLLASDYNDLDRRLTATPWECATYWHIRDIYEWRNMAVHGAEERFPDQLARQAEYTLEQLLLLSLDWVVGTRASSFDEYLAAINEVPGD